MTLADVEWDACVLEPQHDRELEAYVRRALGAVPSAVPYFTASPWIVRSMATLSYFGSPLVHIDYALADLVGLVVSQDNSCRYCYGMQRIVMRVHGMPEARIRADRAELPRSGDRPAHEARARLRAPRSRAPRRSVDGRATHDALLAAGWEPLAIVELAYQAAYNVFMNRLMTTAAIPVAPVERDGGALVARLDRADACG